MKRLYYDRLNNRIISIYIDKNNYFCTIEENGKKGKALSQKFINKHCKDIDEMPISLPIPQSKKSINILNKISRKIKLLFT